MFLPVAFDFGKEVNLGAPLLPTGNIRKEMKILLNHYKVFW
jgi:hypothetical protein